MILNHLKEWIKPLAKYPFSVHLNVVLIILMASLLPMLASLGFIVWWVYKVRSRTRGFKPMAKLLLGDDLQNPKLNEETAWQILSLIQSPVSTVTHNLTQSSTTNTQQEPVTRVPASLVTTKPSDQGIPLPPPTKKVDATYQKNLSSKIHRTYSRSTKRGYVRTRTNGTHNEKIQKIPTETEYWWWWYNYN